MIFELVGSRALGPYFGTSIFVWTSLIGIVLASLSVGYWLGGKMSDTKPSLMMLSAIVFFSAVALFAMAILKDPILAMLSDSGLGMRSGSVISSILLFFPASLFLGMVSPYAVRLKIRDMETTGSTVGSLYAISTVGSIVGTFAAGFLLVPMFGTDRLLFMLGFVLAGLSIIIYAGHLRFLKIALFVMALAGYGFGPIPSMATGRTMVADVDTAYNRVWIEDDSEIFGSGVRLMRINHEFSSGMYLEKEDLVFEYTKYYRLARHFFPEFRSALMLGGAGYSYPKTFLAENPESTIDVVEIDPGLTDLAKRYFRLKDDPRMGIIHEDGRTYINRTQKKYDVILGDAFKSQYSLPFQLTTREAAKAASDILDKDGVYILNVISAIDGEKGEFLRAEYATFKSVFPRVYLFPVSNLANPTLVQNVVLVALKSDTEPSFESDNPELDSYLGHLWQRPIAQDMPILTDDYAPVDSYANKTL